VTGKRVAAAVAAVAVLSACQAVGQDPAANVVRPAPAVRQGPSQLRPVHDPGEVTGTLAGPCRFRSGDSGDAG